MSAIMKHKNPKNQLVPDSKPRYGGKIKLPAPKNIAKRARPMVMLSFMIFLSFTVSHPFFFSLFHHSKGKRQALSAPLSQSAVSRLHSIFEPETVPTKIPYSLLENEKKTARLFLCEITTAFSFQFLFPMPYQKSYVPQQYLLLPYQHC